MSMGDIIPTIPLNNGGNGGWGGDAFSAGIGAFIGSLFGNGVGGWGGNNRGGWGNNCGGGYGGAPIVINAESGHGHCGCNTAELDALAGLQASVNAVGLNVIQGQNAANLAACQGFSGVVAADAANTAQLQNSMNQGFAGLNTVIQGGDAANQQTLCQGFSGVNAAIMGAAKDAALQNCQSTGAITSAIEQCCCNTQKAIAEQGQATRDLISKYAYENVQEKLCDAKSKIASLEAQNALAASQAAQTAQFQHMLNQQSVQFGTVLSAYRTGRIDQRDSTAAAAATPAA